MTFAFAVGALRRHLRLVMALTCLGVLVAGAWALFGPRHYTSSGVVLIGTAEAEADETTGLGDYVVSRMTTYGQLTSSAAVLDEAGLAASDLSAAGQLGSSPMLRLSARGATPHEARRNDQALIAAFARVAPQLNDAADRVALVVQPVDPPSLPERADPPSGLTLWLPAVAGGLLSGVIAACSWEVLLAARRPAAHFVTPWSGADP